jgi:hypothetical protein
MRKLPASLIGALLCLALACSPRNFLTRRLAADLIAGSDTFKTAQLFWLRTGVVSNKDYMAPEQLVLQHRGWLIGTSVACLPNVAPPPCWNVILTPLGVETVRDLIPGSIAPSQYFSVPVARRQLLGVTGISKNGNTADVDFQWKWMPLNEVGDALHSGSVPYNSTVGFRYYDDGWRLVEGSAPKSSQGLDEALKNAEAAQ